MFGVMFLLFLGFILLCFAKALGVIPVENYSLSW